MHRQILYPTYINNYYYDKGECYIRLERSVESKIIYKKYLEFDKPEEALAYFETQCGA